MEAMLSPLTEVAMLSHLPLFSSNAFLQAITAAPYTLPDDGRRGDLAAEIYIDCLAINVFNHANSNSKSVPGFASTSLVRKLEGEDQRFAKIKETVKSALVSLGLDAE